MSQTPAAGTAAAQELLARLRQQLTAVELAALAAGALDRDELEALVRHEYGPAAVDLSIRSRLELAVELLGHAQRRGDPCLLRLCRALDRAGRIEQGLVASLAPEQAELLSDMPSLRFRRQGAKLVWAVLRDERPAIHGRGADLLARYRQLVEEHERLSAAATQVAGEAAQQLEAYYGPLAQESVSTTARALQRPALDQDTAHAQLSAQLGLARQAQAQAQARAEQLQRELAELRVHADAQRLDLHASAERQAIRTAQLEQQLEQLRSAHEELRRQERSAAHQRVAGLRLLRSKTEALLQAVADSEPRARGARLLRLERAGAAPARAPAPVVLATSPSDGPGHAPCSPGPSPHGQAPPPPAEPGAASGSRSAAQRGAVARDAPPDAAARVALFVDVANLAGAARLLYQANIDYGHLLAAAGAGRPVVLARAYAIDKAAGFADFAHALERQGYLVLSKRPQAHPDGSLKADWDVALAVDALLHRDRYDVLALATGDGDLLPLVEACRSRQTRVEVLAFAERASAALLAGADSFVALDQAVLLAGPAGVPEEPD